MGHPTEVELKQKKKERHHRSERWKRGRRNAVIALGAGAGTILLSGLVYNAYLGFTGKRIFHWKNFLPTRWDEGIYDDIDDPLYQLHLKEEDDEFRAAGLSNKIMEQSRNMPEVVAHETTPDIHKALKDQYLMSPEELTESERQDKKDFLKYMVKLENILAFKRQLATPGEIDPEADLFFNTTSDLEKRNFLVHNGSTTEVPRILSTARKNYLLEAIWCNHYNKTAREQNMNPVSLDTALAITYTESRGRSRIAGEFNDLDTGIKQINMILAKDLLKLMGLKKSSLYSPEFALMRFDDPRSVLELDEQQYQELPQSIRDEGLTLLDFKDGKVTASNPGLKVSLSDLSDMISKIDFDVFSRAINPDHISIPLGVANQFWIVNKDVYQQTLSKFKKKTKGLDAYIERHTNDTILTNTNGSGYVRVKNPMPRLGHGVSREEYFSSLATYVGYVLGPGRIKKWYEQEFEGVDIVKKYMGIYREYHLADNVSLSQRKEEEAKFKVKLLKEKKVIDYIQDQLPRLIRNLYVIKWLSSPKVIEHKDLENGDAEKYNYGFFTLRPKYQKMFEVQDYGPGGKMGRRSFLDLITPDFQRIFS